MVQASDGASETEPPAPEPATEVRLQLDSSSVDEPDIIEASIQSPRTALASSLREQTTRLRIAKVRAEFEQTLLTILTLNVIYMYYIDHKLIVLLIRACQVFRLLHFPYASQTSQRGTAVLLLVSNLLVLLIHKMLFSGPGVQNNIGEMLFINFVGPEPKSLPKILTVDCIIITLQAMLLQCKWEWETCGFHLLSALPVPISEDLIPVQPEEIDEDEDSSSSATT